MFPLNAKNNGITILGAVNGISAIGANYLALGMVDNELKIADSPLRHELVNSWLYKNAPFFCLPLVRLMYSNTYNHPNGLSRQTVFLYRSSHICFCLTVLVLLVVRAVYPESFH
jgi:hypothetical protein